MKKTSFSTFLILLLVYSASLAQGDWTLTYPSGPNAPYFHHIHGRTNGRVTLSSDRGVVYSSTDGGQSIQEFQVPNDYSLYFPIVFTSEQQGFIGGGCWFPFDVCKTGLILETTDGGATWVRREISPDLGVFAFLSAQEDGTVFALGDYGSLYRRSAATSVWDSLGLPTGGVVAGYHTDMQFVNPQKGWIQRHTHTSTNKLQLFETSDGGQTWNLLQDSIPVPLIYNGRFHFLNEQKGFFAAGPDHILQTNDGGLTFTEVSPFENNFELQELYFYDEEIGYAVTENFVDEKYAVYRTEDAGDSWQLDFTLDSLRIGSFSVVDKEEAYLLTTNSQIFRRQKANAIADPGQAPCLTIWPNPSAGTITVKCEQPGRLQLFSREGRIVVSEWVNQQQTLHLDHLPSGVYTYVLSGKYKGQLTLH